MAFLAQDKEQFPEPSRKLEAVVDEKNVEVEFRCVPVSP
eukprot:COSAG06_NODE_26_length_32102_cov_250.952911_38_plen_39_part_00